MTVEEINALPADQMAAFLRTTCTAERWIERMVAARPFKDRTDLLDSARIHWAGTNEEDWRQAFEGHPMIGDIDSLRAKYHASKDLSSAEQAGATGASEATLQALAEGNKRYLKRHGFIFIVFASGKTADQMLELLNARIDNSTDQELKLAAQQQLKITLKRLDEAVL
ncbi:2-oxo-4-hydroxy-4-carboxy-5-ureidoimidazoline decarboxylase [Saccharospirillum sp. HFRX-1]|uniref:2-oxo-4-hydroxy-4-carboxy-5-ureidoimidazoline decarboxylase n=1 Tax=unclassified Saccharospirillum TaxID=2633430 RepID=UPI003712085F